LKISENKLYTDKLRLHYEVYFGIAGQKLNHKIGPIERLHPDFYILEFQPNERYNFWIYCTVGMSLDREDDNLIELFIFSPRQDMNQLELLTMCSSFHRTQLPLNLHHTINIGRPWLDNSICDHCFISLPYLDGQKLELFDFYDKEYHIYWMIPITERERDFKIKNGCDALEQLFEEKGINYLQIERECLLS
jgi:Suppressor of fused protein (SUFU)